MPSYDLVITDGAESDIAEAEHWYQEQAALGGNFIESIGRQLKLIEQQPFANQAVANGIYRSVVARFPYNVYYAINGNVISILAVWHGNRNQDRLFSQLGESG